MVDCFKMESQVPRDSSNMMVNGEVTGQNNGRDTNDDELFNVPIQNRFTPLNKESESSFTIQEFVKIVNDNAHIVRRFKRFIVSIRCDECVNQFRRVWSHPCSKDIIFIEGVRKITVDYKAVKCHLQPIVNVWWSVENKGYAFPSPSPYINVDLQNDQMIKDPFSRVVIYNRRIPEQLHIQNKVPKQLATKRTFSDQLEYRLGCRKCARVVRDEDFLCTIEEHTPGSACSQSNLFARERSDNSDGWHWIRRPPENKRKFFRICNQNYNELKSCLRGKKCSFPHGELEKNLWEDDRDKTLPFTVVDKVQQLRSTVEHKFDIFEDYCTDGKTFFFGCPECQKLGIFTNDCRTHDLPLVLIYGSRDQPDSMEVIHRRNGTRNQTSNSSVEKDVWEYIDDRNIPREQFVQQVSSKLLPQDVKIVDMDEEDLIAPFPFSLKQECRTCLHQFQRKSEKPNDGETCSYKAQPHPWLPAYISKITEEEIRRHHKTCSVRVCEIKNCQADSHPHSIKEADVWYWLKNHDTTLDKTFEDRKKSSPSISEESTTCCQTRGQWSIQKPRKTWSKAVSKQQASDVDVSMQDWRELFVSVCPEYAKNHDAMLACETCLNNTDWNDIEINQVSPHPCQCNIFLIKRANSKTWTRLRKRPTKPANFQFELCKFANEGKSCNFRCYFPHSQLELDIWKARNFEVPKVCKKLKTQVHELMKKR